MADNSGRRQELGEVGGSDLAALITEALRDGMHLDAVVHADGPTFWASGSATSGTSTLLKFGEVRDRA
ncbi:MAG: hypothetical protein J0H43_14340 [Actinobacteria bacterium]|nr:hypothetical protein [Actinomycetota bacterium]